MAKINQCIRCRHYCSKLTSENPPASIGGPLTITPQQAVDYCGLDDTLIEDDNSDCPAFSTSEKNNEKQKYVEYSTTTNELSLDDDVTRDLIKEARTMVFDQKFTPDEVVEEFVKRELSDEEAKIIVNKALNNGKKRRGLYVIIGLIVVLFVIIGVGGNPGYIIIPWGLVGLAWNVYFKHQ